MNATPKPLPHQADALSGSALYDHDFVAWTEEQAQLLRAGRMNDLDRENLLDEVESLGGSDRRSTDSQLVRLLHHLLKWRYRSDRRGPSWQQTINNARVELDLLFEQSPSLRRHAQARFTRDYGKAVPLAISETGLPGTTFPDEPPFTLEQALDSGFWPD